MQPQSIAIIGAGTAGLATAALLAEQGHHITLIERAEALAPVGAGLLLQPTGLSVLKDMGLYQAMLGYGARVDALIGHTRDGRRIMNTAYRSLDDHSHGLGIHRASLCHVLDCHLQTLPHERLMGCTVSAVEVAEAHTTVIADNAGEPCRRSFDAVLIANGSHSRLRPTDWTRYDRLYPWGAMWAIQPMVESFAAPLLQQRYHRASQMVGILPTGCCPEQPNQPLASFFWSLPVAQMRHWQHRDFDFSGWRDQALQLWPQLETLLAPLTHQDQLLPATYRDVIMHRGGKPAGHHWRCRPCHEPATGSGGKHGPARCPGHWPGGCGIRRLAPGLASLSPSTGTTDSLLSAYEPLADPRLPVAQSHGIPRTGSVLSSHGKGAMATHTDGEDLSLIHI